MENEDGNPVRTLIISTLLSSPPSFSFQFYKCFNALIPMNELNDPKMNYFDNILYTIYISELFLI